MELMPHAVNLNILRVFDALVQHRSVSVAARQLTVTQSAVSHALRQLRQLFNDPLLVRGRQGMVPTPCAERLAQRLRRGFTEIEQALTEEHGFNPATTQRTFTVATWDHVAAALLEGLAWRGPLQTAQLGIRVVPFDRQQTPAELESGRVDVAIGTGLENTAGLRQRVLMSDTFACIIGRDHPGIHDRVEIEHLAQYRHVVIGHEHKSFRQVQRILAKHGAAIHVAFELPYALLAPVLVGLSDMILIAPRLLGTLFALGYPLRVLPAPFALPQLRETAFWHTRFHTDPAHRWFREQLTSCIDTFVGRVLNLSENLVGNWPDAFAPGTRAPADSKGSTAARRALTGSRNRTGA